MSVNGVFHCIEVSNPCPGPTEDACHQTDTRTRTSMKWGVVDTKGKVSWRSLPTQDSVCGKRDVVRVPFSFAVLLYSHNSYSEL